jgi:hypothetical protein
LRYWTSEMCSNAPHLFDFVVTVSLVPILYGEEADKVARWRRYGPIHFVALPKDRSPGPTIRSRISWVFNQFRFLAIQAHHGQGHR